MFTFIGLLFLIAFANSENQNNLKYEIENVQDTPVSRTTCNVIGGVMGRLLCELHCTIGHEAKIGFCNSNNICECKNETRAVSLSDQMICHMDCRQSWDGGYVIEDGECNCYNVDGGSVQIYLSVILLPLVLINFLI